MAEGLKIEIVSPERLVLSDTVQSVTVPGTEGYFTVMENHAPFMTTLRHGFITVTTTSGASDIFFVQGGFADVSPEGLTILAEQASPFSEFSHEALQGRIRGAEEELNRAQTPDDRTTAQQVLSALQNLAGEAGQMTGTHVL